MFVLLALLFACSGEAPPIVPPPGEPVVDAALAAPAAPAAARVFFVSPQDGESVKSPLKVVFGVEGMTVKPAGELAEGTGHHHLILDAAPIAPGTAVPADARHIHYGLGQTETEVELTPGPHTLTMQFADGLHGSYGPAMSATIQVVVGE